MYLEDDVRFAWMNDGTATLTGTAVVFTNAGGGGADDQKWQVEAEFTYRGKGSDGIGSGGPKCANNSTAAAWEFFDLLGTSKLTNLDNGDVVTLAQAPASSEHPFQMGANKANCEVHTSKSDGKSHTGGHGDHQPVRAVGGPRLGRQRQRQPPGQGDHLRQPQPDRRGFGP